MVGRRHLGRMSFSKIAAVAAAAEGRGQRGLGWGCVWWGGFAPGSHPGLSAPAPSSCATSYGGSGTRFSPEIEAIKKV